MIISQSIIISKKIQSNNSLLKAKSFTASLSVHASVFFALAYFMTSHPVTLEKPKDRMVISLSDFTLSNGDIHKFESSISEPSPSKIQQHSISQKAIEPLSQPLQTTPKVVAKTLEGTQSLTPSVSPEASAPLASTPMPASSLPIKSIDSPQATSFSAPVHELPRNPVSDKQIGGAALGHIRAMIEKAIIYPSIARKLRLEGVVLVTFILKSDGTVETVHIKSSSGSNVLDTKAVQTILSLSGDYPVLGKTVELNIPVAFSLS